MSELLENKNAIIYGRGSGITASIVNVTSGVSGN
jgi:hypothetical protein